MEQDQDEKKTGIRKFFNWAARYAPVIGMVAGVSAVFTTAALGIGKVDGNADASVALPMCIGAMTFLMTTLGPLMIDIILEGQEFHRRVDKELQGRHKKQQAEYRAKP